MRRFLQILLLWSINCTTLCIEHVVDGSAVLRLRNGIKKIPHTNNAEEEEEEEEKTMTTNNGDTDWMPKINKIGVPRAVSPSFMQQLDEISFGNFPGSVTFPFRDHSAPKLGKYYNHSLHSGNAVHMFAAPTTTVTSIHVRNGRHGTGRIRKMRVPWRRVVRLPKVTVEQRQNAFRTVAGVPSLSAFTEDNSGEMALLLNRNSPQTSHLSAYQQQQQQTYYRSQQPVYSPRIQSEQGRQHSAVQTYYNPLDPFGLFNNPFWKALFPSLFVPQPQLSNTFTPQPQSFSVPAPRPAQNQGSQRELAVLPKKYRRSPNQKLALCCQKRNLSPSCQNLCNYDTFTDRSLVTAVLTNQCPGNQLETAFNCATAMADHTACCIRSGIGAYNGGRCMVFCTTHLGNPGNALQYVDCLQVFDRIKNCYREYHLIHPNIYGDL